MLVKDIKYCQNSHSHYPISSELTINKLKYAKLLGKTDTCHTLTLELLLVLKQCRKLTQNQ